MSKLHKKIRQQADDLISTAYTRELNFHLNELAQKFDEWRENKIDCWDLNELIHQFHHGISQDLYKLYNPPREELLLVSRAIVQGFLKKDELSKELLELINPITSSIQNDFKER